MQLFKCITILLFAALLSACGSNENAPTDTLSSGEITISVDETYRPIIEQQLKVFDSSYPKAHITAQYKPESQCIQDFMEGKAKLILVTRDLLKEE